MVSQNLARNIWINAVEREENEKEDLLAKVLVNIPLNCTSKNPGVPGSYSNIRDSKYSSKISCRNAFFSVSV